MQNDPVLNALLNLTYDDIEKSCGSNDRTIQICNDPVFWEMKAKKDFGRSLSEVNERGLSARDKYVVLLGESKRNPALKKITNGFSPVKKETITEEYIPSPDGKSTLEKKTIVDEEIVYPQQRLATRKETALDQRRRLIEEEEEIDVLPKKSQKVLLPPNRVMLRTPLEEEEIDLVPKKEQKVLLPPNRVMLKTPLEEEEIVLPSKPTSPKKSVTYQIDEEFLPPQAREEFVPPKREFTLPPQAREEFVPSKREFTLPPQAREEFVPPKREFTLPTKGTFQTHVEFLPPKREFTLPTQKQEEFLPPKREFTLPTQKQEEFLPPVPPQRQAPLVKETKTIVTTPVGQEVTTVISTAPLSFDCIKRNIITGRNENCTPQGTRSNMPDLLKAASVSRDAFYTIVTKDNINIYEDRNLLISIIIAAIRGNNFPLVYDLIIRIDPTTFDSADIEGILDAAAMTGNYGLVAYLTTILTSCDFLDEWILQAALIKKDNSFAESLIANLINISNWLGLIMGLVRAHDIARIRQIIHLSDFQGYEGIGELILTQAVRYNEYNVVQLIIEDPIFKAVIQRKWVEEALAMAREYGYSNIATYLESALRKM